MGVNVEVECDEVDERDYSGGWLGVCGDMVVLFHASGCGTVVVNPDDGDCMIDFAYYSDDWDMDMFEPFCGTVKLTNDEDSMIVLDSAEGE